MAVMASARLPTSSGRRRLMAFMAANSRSSGWKLRWPMLRVNSVRRISGPTIRSTSSQPRAMDRANIAAPTVIDIFSAWMRRCCTMARSTSAPMT